MMEQNPKVDWFFAKDSPWKQSYALLRKIALSTGLREELKWGHPCYTLNGKNVTLIHGFKEYCALLFHKGALLKDEAGILVQQTRNVQAARQLRFTDLAMIKRQQDLIKAYIEEAIAVERSGRSVPMRSTGEFEMPEEFSAALKRSPALKKAFQALTPGRQRGYLLHFAQAKQARTREARVQKHTERILQGKGLDD